MATDKLMIGWASEDVTPYGKKVDLAGQFQSRITDEINDPVTVTALAVSSGEKAENMVVFISCDTVSIPAYLIDECEEKIRKQLKNFPLTSLVLNATHTHAGPATRSGLFDYNLLSEEEKDNFMMPDDYRDFLSDKIADVVIESWNSRKKGFIAWGSGCAVVGHNRRISYLKDFEKQNYPGVKIEKNARMYGNSNDPDFSHIEGYEDHSVQFLFTFDADKKLTGSIINIPCPSQCTESWKKISADFWHETKEVLRKEYGEELFVLPQCAAAGDQSPHLLIKKAAEARMLALKEDTALEQLDFNLAQRREIGRRIKMAFDDTLQWASKDIRDQIELIHISRQLDLSRRKVTEFEYQQNLEWIEEFKKADSKKERAIARCQNVVKSYEEQKNTPTYPIEIHVIKLGDIAFASNPFELYLDYGLRIQARCPAEQTFIIQLAGSKVNSEGAENNKARFPNRGGSYLSTKRAEMGGSYGATVYCNQIGSDGGQELVEGTLEELEKLFPEKPSK